MKPLLFTAIVLFIGLAGRGQTITSENFDSVIKADYGRTLYLPYFPKDERIKYCCAIANKSDTLTLSDTSIHFIKIGEQVFEIKRSVTLAPAIPKTLHQGNYLQYLPYLNGSGVTAIPQAGITLLNSNK